MISLQSIKELIEKGAKFPESESRTKILVYALADYNATKIMYFLFDQGFNAEDFTDSIIAKVIYKRDLDLIHLLMNRVPQKFDRQCLSAAIKMQKPDIIQFILDQDVDPNICLGDPLLNALILENKEIINILFSRGARASE